MGGELCKINIFLEWLIKKCVYHITFDDISSILSIRSIKKKRKRERQRQMKLPFVMLVVMGGVRYKYINIYI